MSIKDLLQEKENCNNSSSALVDILNPIADEVRDRDLLFYRANGKAFIPFLDGGDATLKFLLKMRKLSPTHGAIIKSIITYCFGGDMTIIRKNDGFDGGEEIPVSSQEKAKYIDFIKSFTDPFYLIKLERQILDSYKTFGNAYLEVVRTNVGGTPYVFFNFISGDRARYIATSDWESRYIFISPEWTTYYINKYPPKVASVYPFWDIYEDGTERTIIHLKCDVLGRDWYGEPDSIMSIYYQLMEVQQGQYSTKGYAREWTAKTFIETVGDSEDVAGKKAFDQAIEKQFSNRGQAMQVLHRQRTPDTDASSVFNFPSNTKESFHKVMGEIAETQIIKSHDWHPILFSKTTGSMGNSQEFINVFKVKNISVIEPLQNTILSSVRLAISLAAEWLGFDENGLAIGAKSPFQALVEQEQALKNQPKGGAII